MTRTSTLRESASSSGSRSAVLRRACACGRHMTPGDKCEDCKKMATSLQRQTDRPTQAPSVPTSAREVVFSPGQPLDHAARSWMEPKFGHDFSGVRVHTNSQAAESANSVRARAYTFGNNIVFG